MEPAKSTTFYSPNISLFIVTLLLLVFTSAQAGVYTIARAPQSDPLELRKAWQPLIDYLNESTREQFILKLFSSREEFEQSLFAGEPDFVYANGFYFITASEKHGYTSLVRSNSKLLKGIIVAPINSNINSIQDLNGKKIAFPSPNALGASLYVRAKLEEQSIQNIESLYVGTHDKVYQNILLGRVAAGGGIHRTFNSQSKEIRSRLKIIYETPGLAAHPLFAHPRTPKTLRQKVIEAILALEKNNEGKKLLQKVKLTSPVKADDNADYGIIKKLQIKKFSTIQ